MNLTVLAAAPVTAISPANLPTGADLTTVTVNGTGFDPAAVVQLNGVSLAAKFIDSHNLQITPDRGYFA